MKSSYILAAGLLGVAVLLTGQAQAGTIETINFDALGGGPPFGTPPSLIVVTNQFPDVVFSSPTPGYEIIVMTTTGYNTSSPPNLICTATGNGPTPFGLDCTKDVELSFSVPVDTLTFDAFGNDGTPDGGTFALADVYVGGIDTHPNIPLLVSHGADTTPAGVDADPQVLNFTGITEVVIHGNTDVAGTAYDNFTFTPDALPTPEPATLLLTGLCGIAWAGRRFLARQSR